MKERNKMKGKLERKSTPESEALEESASDPLESIEHERKEESLYEKQDESLIEERTMEARKEFDAAIEKLKPKSRRKNINELVVRNYFLFLFFRILMKRLKLL